MPDPYREGSITEPYRNSGSNAARSEQQATTPGQQAIVLAALFIALLLLGVQLWLLTVALDLYLAGLAGPIWSLPVISGLIFLGGLLVLRLLKKQSPPRI